MTEPVLVAPQRGRSWRFDALIGAGAALVALSTAHASLPPDLRPAVRPTPPAAITPTPAPPQFSGLIAFVEPVSNGVVNSPFGMRKLPWEEGGRLHEGVDIAADSGVPVLAAADGVVVRAGQDGGYGRFVEVRHAAGLTTFYAHLGAIDPAAVSGAAIKAGAPLGAIGNSGSSTGPHLHFEVRNADQRPLNPAYFIGQSFQTAEDLPLRRAARIGRSVRVAYVSHIPQSKRELMEARELAKAQVAEARSATTAGVEVAALATGRPHARLDLLVPVDLQKRRALVAQVAAAQHAQIAAEGPQAAPAEIKAPVALDAGDTAS